MKISQGDGVPAGLNRRAFMGYFAGSGLAMTLFPGTLWAQTASAKTGRVTVEMVEAAEGLAGLTFTNDERKSIASGVNRLEKNYATIRELPIRNDVPPAFQFNPLPPGFVLPSDHQPFEATQPKELERPKDLEQLAYWSVLDLSALLQSKKVSSVELTTMYLARLKRHDPQLHCVITLTEARAMRQAKQADREIAAGQYRGLLHGIPWGAKDLISAKGYPTTWGAEPYREQEFDIDATVVRRLDEAGAVLVAKLSLGALAQNDIWFGGQTRNPWNTKRGSSGSSAGPGSATGAGLVPFAIGSETSGSILSPSTVCGVTGLRPTYGRVSRHGVMALSWTMDKLGPMCRTVEDCAIVLNAIMGSDENDATAVDAPFNWNAERDARNLRVGYLTDSFDNQKQGHNEASLDVLRKEGFDLVPVSMPDLPYNALSFILETEAAAAFDTFTRSDQDDQLLRSSWPNAFRLARMVPAVEYIQAQRLRTLLIREMAKVMEPVDVVVSPTMHHMLLGNLTGHPMVSVPDGFSESGNPTSIGFIGKLYGEADMLAVAKHFQDLSGHHLKYPPGFS